MKASIIPAAVILMLLSCERLEPRLQSGPERRNCYGPPGHVSMPQDSCGGEDIPGPAPGDTVIWLCAVEYPPGYPWRKDSLHLGTVPEIVLYRDFVPVLRVPSGEGASPDPDMQHILDGHLYTEDSSMTETVVKRDGKTLYCCEGREMLRGIAVDGDDVYTLSQYRSGEGFSYRKNGELLMSRESGQLFGSLSDPSYGPGGALYEDGGEHVFCYSYGYAGSYRYGLFRNGVESFSDSGRRMDVKCVGGKLLSAPSDKVLFAWEDVRIWVLERGVFWAGTGALDASSSTRGSWLYDAGLNNYYMMGRPDGLVMPAGMSAVSVLYGRDGEVSVCWWNKVAERLDGRFMYMGDGCVDMVGETLVLALTPKGHGACPVVMVGGEARTLDINGYISCVKVCLYT